ncbi:PAS domain S-box protein [Melioribacteraceae bacterium 4301-Me]|uniref:sensor histidine kinase n=1 Tax=Pyranulibacter aquaticus TaxID=3163344 RepID=UPI003596CE65
MKINSDFTDIINALQTVLYEADADLKKILFISNAVRMLYGYTPEEIYKTNSLLKDAIYSEDLIGYNNFIEKIKNGEESSVQYRIKDRFGKEHWVKHTGVPIFKDGKLTKIVGTLNDITEEKIIQLKLEKSEERFRTLIETADDLMFILDGFGYFTLVNSSGAKALGYNPEDMKGKHFLEFIAKEDETKIAEAFQQILNNKNSTIFEAKFINKSNKEVIFEIHARPTFSDGEISGMLSIGRNITNRIQNEKKIRDLNAKLIEANRIISIERERAKHKINVLEELNRLKSEFISNISHELRTPLASIVGFAETIINDSDIPRETILEFNEIILSEGKRLAKLINDLLDFSKLETGEEKLNISSFNLIQLINEIINEFDKQLKKKELVLTKDFPKEEVILNGDYARLSKVFTNLLSNAVKFTGNGGRISVIINDFEKEVEIDISDTGVGIPEKEIPNLFQKFSKIKSTFSQATGVGFGLVAVKQIIDLHKGLISVKSQVGNGTTFIIRLPK